MTILGGGFRFKPVMEKFVGGDSKEFRIIEDELKKIIQIIKSQINTTGKAMINVSELNKSDHVKMIERQFKQYFGLKEFSMQWKTSPDPNAYTYCKSFMFLDDKYKQDSKGRHSNDNLFVGVNLHTGLVTYANMNEKEIMAIILHEIGHNFYNSVFHTMAMMGGDILQSVLVMGIFDLIKFNELMHKGSAAIRNFFAEKLPGVTKVYNTIENVIYDITTIFKGIIIFNPLYFLNMLTFGWVFRYSVEKHADSFAVDYGYGPYLASGLDKLRKQEKSLGAKVYKVPGLNWLYDLMDLNNEILVAAFGGYPSIQNRIRTGLDRLKASANDPDLDPRVRAELQKQIKEYEKFYAGYLELDKDENKRKIFTTLYHNAMEKMFAGKCDIREIIQACDEKAKAY